MNKLQISRELLDTILLRSSLFLIMLQSCGIRFFNGIGVSLLVVILVLNISSIKRTTRKEFCVLSAILLIVSIYVYSSHLASNYYCYLLVISPFFFLKNYQLKRTFENFQSDFIFVLRWIFIHAFCGYLLYLLFGFLFIKISIDDMSYKTFLYLFYVSPGVSLIDGLYRNVGMFWEPGLLQFFLNLYLYLLMVSGKCTKVSLILITVNILFTNSTAGLLLLLINIAYYFLFYRKITLRYIVLAVICFIAISPIVMDNLEQKFSGKNQTSGQVRTRDMLIGSFLIYEKPLLGHGYYDLNYLIKNESVNEIDLEVMNEIFVQENGDLSGGYTNGLFDLFIKYGIPLSLLFLFLFYKNKICHTTLTRSFFLLLCIMTFISEPITNTSLFYTIAFSSIFLNKAYEDETDINYHCNI